MTRRLWGFVAVIMLACSVLLGATWYYTPRATFGVGDLIYADSTSSLNSLPDVAVGSVLVSAGVGVAPAYSGSLPGTIASPERTDGTVFVPATRGCIADVPTLVPVRLAANDWALARTGAGAETFNLSCSVNLDLQRTTAAKGIKVSSVSVVYQVTAQPLTSHTWGKVAATTYANNLANVVSAALDTPIILNTAVQANPYVQTATLAAPAYGPAASLVNLTVEWQAVLQNGTVYAVYGIAVNFSRTDL